MRLGILSDTHDELVRTQQAVRMLRDAGAEALVHCGDLVSSSIVEALAALPSWFVFGNHDADSVPDLLRAAADFGPICLGWGGVIELGSRRIGIVHGHLATDVRRITAMQPHILLSGHSHAASDFTIDSVRRINPGALYRADVFTAAILEVPSGDLQWIRIASGFDA